jgi:hypothetical protein
MTLLSASSSHGVRAVAAPWAVASGRSLRPGVSFTEVYFPYEVIDTTSINSSGEVAGSYHSTTRVSSTRMGLYQSKQPSWWQP